TIAVLGTPLDVAYPVWNRRLQERLMQEQLVVTEFPLGSPLSLKNFPMRNRTMALLSDAVVIVEAGGKRGPRYAAEEAMRLGRALFLMSSPDERTTPSWFAGHLLAGAKALELSALDRLFRVLRLLKG